MLYFDLSKTTIEASEILSLVRVTFLPAHQVMPGGRFIYEFDAEPFGMHLYQRHAVPLKRHIHKGLMLCQG